MKTMTERLPGHLTGWQTSDDDEWVWIYFFCLLIKKWVISGSKIMTLTKNPISLGVKIHYGKVLLLQIIKVHNARKQKEEYSVFIFDKRSIHK